MKNKYVFTGGLLLLYNFFWAQEKLIDTVRIVDKHLRDAEKTQKVITVSASDFQKNSTNLSEVLRFQTPFYIKENGRGMTSSPSFRGSTAQQTAFVWNGININSIFLGQGDINNLGLLNFDEMSVKPGGGSILYGSGAIGGSVHLNNHLTYDRGFSGNFFGEYASFNTVNSALKLAYSDEKLSVNLNASFADSQNDYEVKPKKYKHWHAQYNAKHFGLDVGYRLNDDNEIRWHSLLSNGDQHFPIFSENSNRTKYITNGFKSLLNWNFHNADFSNQLSFAYVEDAYDYYADADGARSNGATGKTFVVKNDFTRINPEIFDISLITEYQHNSAEGYGSGIINPKRNWGNAALVLKRDFLEKFYLEAAVRKNFIENIKSPLLFSLGAKAEFSPVYTLKMNLSKNFRFPTFNDLYWEPGGNLDLKPETSYNAELNNTFNFGKLKIDVVPYYTHIYDMIQWKPKSSEVWSPVNVGNVASYGAEAYLNYQQKTGNHQISGNATYTFTRSQNLDTHKSLTYVPVHRATAGFGWKYKVVDAFLQGMFTGKTFTTTDEVNFLKSSLVANAGVGATFGKHWHIGLRVNNVFDEVYQTNEYYFLPLRNYAVNLNYKF